MNSARRNSRKSVGRGLGDAVGVGDGVGVAESVGMADGVTDGVAGVGVGDGVGRTGVADGTVVVDGVGCRVAEGTGVAVACGRGVGDGGTGVAEGSTDVAEGIGGGTGDESSLQAATTVANATNTTELSQKSLRRSAPILTMPIVLSGPHSAIN